MAINDTDKLARLQKAFEADGFVIRETASTLSGKLGITAEHVSAVNHDTGAKKVCYYLEGSPYERGYLLGLLAEPQVSDMAVNFVDNILFDFIGLEFLNSVPLLKNLLVDFISSLSKNTWNAQGYHIHNEAQGLLDGCKKRNASTRVTQARISVMNVGFDVLCALIYTGHFLRDIIPHISPESIKLPMMCNAFSVFGAAAGGGHFFGRDFMFVSGGILQNNLAHIINVPENETGAADKLYPFVSVTAPGIVGSVSVMNINGVAAGLNMSPSASCDPENVGVNSLILLRECIMRGATAYEAADIIKNTYRGVSWNYVLSDGSTDTACTVEAGASRRDTDFLSFPSALLLPFLPDKDFLSSHGAIPVENGAAVRWCGAPQQNEYLSFNKSLWQRHNAMQNTIVLHDDAFTPSGFINRTTEENNCPSSFYFAPQRTGRNVQVTTNHFLSPHMRLTIMSPWTALVSSGNVNDIQWRYDELNHEIKLALLQQGSINYASAKRIIDFLAPYGAFPKYYQHNRKSRDGSDTCIEGCVSLFDLKARTAESHYGYYGDEWIKTTLPNYIWRAL